MEKEKNIRDILSERYPNFFEKNTMRYSYIPKGWDDIFISFLEEAKRYIETSGKCNEFKILQFKQKWFKLRIYHSGGDDYLADLANKTEAIACNYCSKCGKIVDINVDEVIRGKCSGCKNDSW